MHPSSSIACFSFHFLEMEQQSPHQETQTYPHGLKGYRRAVDAMWMLKLFRDLGNYTASTYNPFLNACSPHGECLSDENNTSPPGS
ncbi:hypothetical protein ABKN59_009108 [Abortiporus biennis]